MIPHGLDINNIALICRSFGAGGIETYCLNLANYLVLSEKLNVYLLSQSGVLRSSLSSRVNFVELSGNYASIENVKIVSRVFSSNNNWYVLSTDPVSRFLSELSFQNAMCMGTPVIRHVTGCFHPRAYFIEDEKRIHHYGNWFMSRSLGNDNIFFMNELCASTHLSFLGQTCDRQSIVPLPVGPIRKRWEINGNPGKFRVISVGRMVPFKAYILGLVDVAEKMKEAGINFALDIYGSGPLLCEVLDKVDLLSVSDRVRLLGDLRYSLFQETVAKYDLFIGMGMAAIEAASLGVPTVLCKDSSSSRCYGYIYQVPVGCAGEISSDLPTSSIESILVGYYRLSQAQRISEGFKCRSHIFPLSLESHWSSIQCLFARRPPLERSVLRRALLVAYFLFFHWLPKLFKV